MKNMFESAEVFEAYGIIDYCYFEMRKIQESISRPVSGIDAAIDQACGVNRIAQAKDAIKQLLETIIEKKQFIEADASNDKLMLSELNKLV